MIFDDIHYYRDVVANLLLSGHGHGLGQNRKDLATEFTEILIFPEEISQISVNSVAKFLHPGRHHDQGRLFFRARGTGGRFT